ncbi:MAG: 3-hydroxyacyl-CoA dehydrogenase family protein, partial [Sphingobacterium sp.]
IELEEIKRIVYQKIESVVSPNCVISSNTSAIPINILQQYLQCPERFMGIHWAEPAFATRFLEITCGEQTNVSLAEMIHDEAIQWEKEPTLLYKDVRGFITNRLMYAVYRQGFELINQGAVDIAGLDKCFQYDIGSWITIMGIFKRMDYIGLDHYLQSFQTIFPKLSNSQEVPDQMKKILAEKGRGIHNLNGLYPHTAVSSKELEHNFAVFNEEIYRLADRYRRKLKALNLAESNEKQKI